jgi:PBP1b-binding outer membrane lipoprotein LpoB
MANLDTNWQIHANTNHTKIRDYGENEYMAILMQSILNKDVYSVSVTRNREYIVDSVSINDLNTAKAYAERAINEDIKKQEQAAANADTAAKL